MKTPITFLPAQRCVLCERWTSFGLLVEGDKQDFLPLCAWHGFVEAPTSRKPTQAEIDVERQSVIRFVLAAHSDMGVARIVRRADPFEIPNYEPVTFVDPDDQEAPENRRLLDSAWYVRHHRENKPGRFGWALWREELLTFFWIPEKLEPETEAMELSVAS